MTEGDISSTMLGFFVQDAWTINNKLTVNLGLRTERERVPTYAVGSDIPEFGLEFPFGDKLAPRAGFAYDIKGDGSWKLGRFVGRVLRHLQARTAPRLVRRRQVAVVLLHARHASTGRPWSTARTARRPATAR